MDMIQIGKIVNVVGLKGEVKVYSYSNSKERFEELRCIHMASAEREIEKVRYVKNMVILKLSGIDDREAAEAVKGEGIYISEADLPELPEGEYFIRDLIGLEVVDDKGSLIGSLSDVFQNRAQDLYEVETAGGRKILIPAVEEFIVGVDIEKKRMTVKLIDGLM